MLFHCSGNERVCQILQGFFSSACISEGILYTMMFYLLLCKG